MRYWILMFRPETYELVQQHQTIAVNSQHGQRFSSSLANGHQFIVYISGRKIIDGSGEIVGNPYIDTTPLFGEKRNYPNRCGVRFHYTGAEVPVGDLLWGLTPFDGAIMKTVPANYIFLKGGFLEISKRDYGEINDLVRAASVACSKSSVLKLDGK